MPNRRAEAVENSIVLALSAFTLILVKTITCDQETGFVNWLRIEDHLHCDVYFAGPYYT